MQSKIALFMGKFQPPHLGHIRTIIELSGKYEKIVVGITSGSTKVLEYVKVREILKSIFDHFENIKVIVIEGTVEGGTADLSKIDFDVIVSGNKKVLERMTSRGYEVEFQPRSEGIGYSGSEIRSLSDNYKKLSLRSKPELYEFKLVEVSKIKPLEMVLPSHFENIENLIKKDGAIKKPLIIDNRYNIVLDGSHRYAFLLKYGYKYAPVISVNYDDDAIFVGNRLKHRFFKDNDYIISKSEVVSRGVNENLFDARTTRHFFPFRKKDYETPLTELVKGKEIDISFLIEDIGVEDEIEKDMDYIAEIDDEIGVIEEYLREQNEVKEYLKYQITQMQKKAPDYKNKTE